MSYTNINLDLPGDEISSENHPGLSGPASMGRTTVPQPTHGGERFFGLGTTASDVQRRVTLGTLATVSGLVLGILGLLVTRYGEGGPGWLLAITTLLGGLVLLTRKFEIGILVFISLCWIAIGTPNVATGGSGTGQRLLFSQAGLAVLLSIWIGRLFMRQEFRIYRNPLNAPALLFIGVCVWTTINGLMFMDPKVVEVSFKQYTHVNVFELAIRILSLGAVLMIGNVLKGSELRAASMLVLMPGLATFTGILSFLPHGPFLAFPQILSMAVLAGIVLTGYGKWWLRVGACVIALAIAGNFLIRGAEWSSGWMGAVTALAIVTFVANRRLFYCGVLAASVLLLVNWNSVYYNVVTANQESYSFSRFDMMKAAVLYASHFPLGIGLGNYRTFNSYYGRPEVWGTTSFSSAHGTYSQALSETGWLGLVALLILLGIMARVFLCCYRFFAAGSYERSYALGALGGFVGICVSSLWGDYLFPTYHNGGMATFGSCVYTFLMAGVVLAMAREKGFSWSKSEPAAVAASASGLDTNIHPQRRTNLGPRPAPLIHRRLNVTGSASSTSSASATRSHETQARFDHS